MSAAIRVWREGPGVSGQWVETEIQDALADELHGTMQSRPHAELQAWCLDLSRALWEERSEVQRLREGIKAMDRPGAGCGHAEYARILLLGRGAHARLGTEDVQPLRGPGPGFRDQVGPLLAPRRAS